MLEFSFATVRLNSCYRVTYTKKIIPLSNGKAQSIISITTPVITPNIASISNSTRLMGYKISISVLLNYSIAINMVLKISDESSFQPGI